MAVLKIKEGMLFMCVKRVEMNKDLMMLLIGKEEFIVVSLMAILLTMEAINIIVGVVIMQANFSLM